MTSSSTNFPPIRETIELGAEFIAQTYVRKPDGSPVVSSDVQTWSWRVYDRQSTSEPVTVYSSGSLPVTASNWDGSQIIPASPRIDAYSPHPLGVTLFHRHDPVEVYQAQAGRTYAYVYEFTAASGSGGVQRYVTAELAIISRHG